MLTLEYQAWALSALKQSAPLSYEMLTKRICEDAYQRERMKLDALTEGHSMHQARKPVTKASV